MGQLEMSGEQMLGMAETGYGLRRVLSTQKAGSHEFLLKSPSISDLRFEANLTVSSYQKLVMFQRYGAPEK
jgi:hypothetical protein